MTIDEAKQLSMQTGQKITHRIFLPEEWIQVLPSNEVKTEDNRYSPVPFEWFMEQRKSAAWSRDWSIWNG